MLGAARRGAGGDATSLSVVVVAGGCRLAIARTPATLAGRSGDGRLSSQMAASRGDARNCGRLAVVVCGDALELLAALVAAAWLAAVEERTAAAALVAAAWLAVV